MVFDKKDNVKVKRKLLDKEDVENYFKRIKWNEMESYNYLMWLIVKEINELEYNDAKITTLSISSWWKNPDKVNIKTSYWFKKWVNWLFNKKEIIINKEGVENYFKTIRESENKSFNYLNWLLPKDISKLEYKWNKIINLAKIVWWDTKNNIVVMRTIWFKNFINWLFDNETSKKQD